MNFWESSPSLVVGASGFVIRVVISLLGGLSLFLFRGGFSDGFTGRKQKMYKRKVTVISFTRVNQKLLVIQSIVLQKWIFVHT